MKKPKRIYIRLEPAEIYDKAIVKRAKDGCLTYSYELLVSCTKEALGDDSDDAAVDWVDYNILSLKNDSQHFLVRF